MTVIFNPLSDADELPPYPGVNNLCNNNNDSHGLAYCDNEFVQEDNIDGGRLYDKEIESDVTFVAGIGGDTWRFPGHRAVLANANNVFKAMLTGPLANEDVISVTDVDKRAFEQLMRYLYHQPVTLPSVSTARTTLEAANKYICPGLVKQCVIYLDLHLSSSTVLDVFRDLRFYCSRIPSTSTEPSAPPLQENTGDEAQMTELCDSLIYNCLLFIDEFADDILRQEAIEELSFEDISIITQRDTLKVTCELEFFNALNRWCISECKRCKKELTSANKRQVLGELSYSVRYLLMSENEFFFGPKASELLDLTECDLIIRRMKGDRSVQFSTEQESLLRKFASPRVTSSYLQPIHLSNRSAPRNPVDMENQINNKIDSKKSKKQRKKEAKALKRKIKEDERDSEEKGACCSCSCFGQGLLRAFVFIFD